MNTIQELPIQNQQDFWSMLYMHLGKSIMEICGRRGEGAIRHGLHKMAEDDGRRFREECIKQGAKTNLRSLYAMGCACSCDPRVRTKTLCDEEQVHLWETYTCPLANLWLDNDQAFLGNLYCEENQQEDPLPPYKWLPSRQLLQICCLLPPRQCGQGAAHGSIF